MSMITITSRCLKILKILSKNDAPVSAKNIADELHVSVRTVRYDVDLLSSWLKEHNIELSKKPNKGISIDSKYSGEVESLLKEQNYGSSNSTYLTSDERVKKLIEMILDNRKRITFDQLTDIMGISRTTLLRDLDKVDEWFKHNHAPLVHNHQSGLQLEVEEPIHRALTVEYIIENTGTDSYLSFSNAKLNDTGGPSIEQSYIEQILDISKLRRIQDILERYTAQKQLFLSDEAFIWVVYYICVMLRRVESGHFIASIPSRYSSWKNSAESKEIEDIMRHYMKTDMSADCWNREATYIATRIMASSKTKAMPVNKENSVLAGSVSQLIIEKASLCTGIDLCADRELVQGLKTHLQALIMRNQLNMHSRNELLVDIEKRFPALFEICTKVTAEIAKKYNITFDEDEIGFVTMYLEASMVRMENSPEKLRDVRTVLICGYGIGTVSFLTHALEREFPNVLIVDRISVFKMGKYDFSDVDLILTTINLPYVLPKPTIKVSPTLTRVDIRRIESFFYDDKQPITKSVKIDEIVQTIRENCEIHDENKLREELTNVLQGKKKVALSLTSDMPSLSDVLLSKYCLAHIHAESWDDAVWQAAKPLIDAGCTGNRYVQKIIDIRKEFGQYALISRLMCIPHAEPDSGNTLAVSLVTLDNPIEVNTDEGNIPLSIFMVISLVDGMSQAKVLDEIFGLCDEFPTFADDIARASTAAELWRVFRTYYEKLFR